MERSANRPQVTFSSDADAVSAADGCRAVSGLLMPQLGNLMRLEIVTACGQGLPPMPGRTRSQPVITASSDRIKLVYSGTADMSAMLQTHFHLTPRHL